MQRGTKNLYAHLDYWFYVPTRSSHANIQILNFEEYKFVSMWRCFYVVTKLIIIYPTTNFYSTSAPKTLLRILTSDSMHLIGYYVSWFKFQILKDTRSSWCFLLTRSIRMYKTLSHSAQNYEFLFFSNNIFTTDLESCTKISGVQWWKPFLNRMFRWEIVVKKRKRLEWTHACRYVSVCVSLCQLLLGVTSRLQKDFYTVTNWF